jgi:hypothetical protein
MNKNIFVKNKLTFFLLTITTIIFLTNLCIKNFMISSNQTTTFELISSFVCLPLAILGAILEKDKRLKVIFCILTLIFIFPVILVLMLLSGGSSF